MKGRAERESHWASVRALLNEARRLLPADADVAVYEDYLADNELELALGSLADAGEALRAPSPFWSLLERAAGSMSLDAHGQRLRWRGIEAAKGYIRASLTVSGAPDGRRTPVLVGYRACWDVGGMYEGVPTLNDAPITIEDAPSIAPGSKGTVRLHPLAPEFWTQVRAGQAITMREGERVVGTAIVLEVIPPVDDARTRG
jgi:hypothetical protein